MSRYIDAEYVNAFPIRIDHYDEEHGNRHFVLGIESVMEYIEEAPHIDIVRCKECKWCDDGNGANRALICTNEYIDIDCHPDFYCGYGEREGE